MPINAALGSTLPSLPALTQTPALPAPTAIFWMVMMLARTMSMNPSLQGQARTVPSYFDAVSQEKKKKKVLHH